MVRWYTQIFIRTLIPATAIMLLAGCEFLNYNGTWSFLDRDEEATVNSYHRFLRDRDLAIAQANARNAPPQQPANSSPLYQQQSNSSYGAQQPTGNYQQGGVIPVWNPNRIPVSDRHASANPAGAQGVIPAQQPSPGRVRQPPVRFSDDPPASVRTSRRPLDVFGTAGNRGGKGGSPLDGTDNVTRVSFSTEGGDFDPDIDATGRWLLFASTRHRETSDIYIKSVSGTTITQLTFDRGNDVSPTFSPDGKRVAFASDRGGSWDIYIVDVRGGQPIQLTSEPTHEVHPSFSPDGRWLVYSMRGSQSGQWEMVVVDIENPAVRRFIGYGLFPRWSPTDNRILFQRARERGTRWFSIWTVELVNGEAMRPTEIMASANAAVITPSWSPDGKHIVFCTVVNPMHANAAKVAKSDVWVSSIQGTNRSNLTNGRFSNLQPRWARDGRIFFVSNRGQGGVENVWALRPDRVMQMAQTLGQNTSRTAKGGTDDGAAMSASEKMPTSRPTTVESSARVPIK